MHNRGTLEDCLRESVVEKHVKVEKPAFVKPEKKKVKKLLQRLVGVHSQEQCQLHRIENAAGSVERQR